jgi:general L-amino acid transport system substrate-binding protein
LIVCHTFKKRKSRDVIMAYHTLLLHHSASELKKIFKKRTSLLAIFLMMLTGWASLASASTLEEVKKRGHLNCGVSEGVTGFSFRNGEGVYQGLDVDFCRAIAAAIFDDPDKVEFVPLSALNRFRALQNEEIDVLSRNTTWTMLRDTSLGLTSVGTIYYDGQSFMVPRDLGVTSVLDLSGAKICVKDGTTTLLNVKDYFKVHGMSHQIIAKESLGAMLEAYEKQECDALSSDASQLYAMRLKLSNERRHMVLPEVISKEPLGPMVRSDDVNWANLVQWVLFALINAEELDISSSNIDIVSHYNNPQIRRFLGKEQNLGEAIGLEAEWTSRIIRHVGHYGEIFHRNVGQGSELNIARGFNALWSQGGLLYAPPLR